MNEFKFDCPSCGQHILAADDWTGRRIDCPSCKTKITIPAPTKTAKKTAPLPPPALKSPLKPSGASLQVATPASPSKDATAQPSSAVAPAKGQREDKPEEAGSDLKTKVEPTTTPPPPKVQLRIAVLTPSIKAEIVRAVRQRIANESAWLPGKVEESLAYAAKVSDGKTILVEERSPEATRFSLIGAFLLEYHLRQVTRTATGRTKLLDQEIPDAVREVLLDEMSEEEREKTDDPLPNVDVTSISHAQCIAALGVLEERYSQRMEQVRVGKAKKNLGNIRLSDLVKKLELKAGIAPEDVATALYHEVMELRRRLDKLENRNAGSK